MLCLLVGVVSLYCLLIFFFWELDWLVEGGLCDLMRLINRTGRCCV